MQQTCVHNRVLEVRPPIRCASPGCTGWAALTRDLAARNCFEPPTRGHSSGRAGTQRPIISLVFRNCRAWCWTAPRWSGIPWSNCRRRATLLQGRRPCGWRWTRSRTRWGSGHLHVDSKRSVNDTSSLVARRQPYSRGPPVWLALDPVRRCLTSQQCIRRYHDAVHKHCQHPESFIFCMRIAAQCCASCKARPVGRAAHRGNVDVLLMPSRSRRRWTLGRRRGACTS